MTLRSAVVALQCEGGGGSRSGARQCARGCARRICVNTQKTMQDLPVSRSRPSPVARLCTPGSLLRSQFATAKKTDLSAIQKGYSSTYLAMGFANVRAGTWYKRALEYLSRYGIRQCSGGYQVPARTLANPIAR